MLRSKFRQGQLPLAVLGIEYLTFLYFLSGAEEVEATADGVSRIGAISSVCYSNNMKERDRVNWWLHSFPTIDNAYAYLLTYILHKDLV